MSLWGIAYDKLILIKILHFMLDIALFVYKISILIVKILNTITIYTWGCILDYEGYNLIIFKMLLYLKTIYGTFNLELMNIIIDSIYDNYLLYNEFTNFLLMANSTLISSSSGSTSNNFRSGSKWYYNESGGLKVPSKEFMSLFIGFVDGDGYIDVGEQKQYNKKTGDLVNSTIRIALGIGLDIRDLIVLETFQEVLGVGLIRAIPNTNKYRYLISRADLVKVIIPLMLKYNLHFLNYNRSLQYSLAKHSLDNDIKQWKNLDKTKVIPVFRPNNYIDISKLPQFNNWLVGFTMAEGSFGIKKSGEAFYSIRQTGIENLELIKAIKYHIFLQEPVEILTNFSNIKADSANSYKISMSSKKNVQKVVNFFSFPSAPLLSLIGYKALSYEKWILELKASVRYKALQLP